MKILGCLWLRYSDSKPFAATQGKVKISGTNLHKAEVERFKPGTPKSRAGHAVHTITTMLLEIPLFVTFYDTSSIAGSLTKQSESNPGRLGGKRNLYLRAILSPLKSHDDQGLIVNLLVRGSLLFLIFVYVSQWRLYLGDLFSVYEVPFSCTLV